MQCVTEEDKHITHKHIRIKDVLDKTLRDCQELAELFKKLKNTIETKYQLIEPIVNYLDNENLHKKNFKVSDASKNVSNDVKNFNEKFI